jgi:hypothetical protein
MAKNYQRFYNLDVNTGTPKGYNAGFYGVKYGDRTSEHKLSESEQEARLKKRSDKYDKWKVKDNRVSQKQLNQEPEDKIGAVSSSWLTSLGYNLAASEAVATFKDSNAEFYYKMSYETFLDWYNSPSKGRWLYEHPSIMHSYTKRGGRGGESMSARISQFHSKNKLKQRGDKGRMKARMKDYLSKWR